MENLENQAVSAESSANSVHLELTAQEVKLSTDCFDRLAQALIQVHTLAQQLSLAEEAVAQRTIEYGTTVKQRIQYITPTDVDTVLSSSSDEMIIERAIAASKVWKARATLDRDLAHHVGRAGRDLLLTIRNFQAENLQISEFQLKNPLSNEKAELESEATATKKPQELFDRFKRASIASIRHCIKPTGGAAERKSMPMFSTSPPNLAAITKVAKEIEDAAVSRAIGDLTEKIFLPIKDIIVEGKVAKNVNICKRNQYAEDRIGISGGDAIIFPGLDGQSGRFETSDFETTLRRQNSMSAVSTNANDRFSNSYSLGEYYYSGYFRERTQQNPYDKAYRSMGMGPEEIRAFEQGIPSPYPRLKRRGRGGVLKVCGCLPW